MKHSKLGYVLISIIGVLGLGAVLAQVNFPDILNTQFPNYMADEGMLHFNYDGNDFEGVIFPMGSETITGVDIVLSGSTKYDCDKQIKGLYYNNARGLRIWPLDQATLSGLRNMDSSYNNLTLTGGLFHSCSGEDENAVYGQLTHTLNSTDYTLIAGVEYNFANNSYISSFSGSLDLIGNKLTGFIFDNRGGIASITSPDQTLAATLRFITGATLKLEGSNYYSSNVGISVLISSNKVSNFNLTGDITTAINGSTMTTTLNPALTTGDAAKTLTINFSTGMETASASGVILLDTTAPTALTLNTPTSGTTVQGDVSLAWAGGDDAGIGIDTYVYSIYNVSGSGTGTVVTLATTGSVTNKTATVDFTTLGTGTYQWTVLASDKLGYTTLSTTGYFFTETAPVDENPDSFQFNKIRKAKISKVYQSNIVILQGLSDGTSVLAELDAGVLMINGNYAGSTGFVENGDVIWIELISSNRYDREVDAELSIGNQSDTFIIETMREDEDNEASDYASALTNSLRWTIWEAFQDLVDIYDNKSLDRQREVFITLKEIIQSKLLSTKIKIKVADSSERELKYKQQLTVLAYLYSYTIDHLTENLDLNKYLIDDAVDYNGVYRAKGNNKAYKLEYSPSKGYYSDDMSSRKYFPTLAAIKEYIDDNNPGF